MRRSFTCSFYLSLNYTGVSHLGLLKCAKLKMENSMPKQEPGAAKFGNFPDYYKFNPPHERMRFVRNLSKIDLQSIVQHSSIKALDIGCNTGDLTINIWQWLSQIFAPVPVDIVGVDIDPELIKCASNKYHEQFKQVNFQRRDVMADSLPLVSGIETRYSVIFCFSVTLWIHINHGDEGLKEFLTMLANSCIYLILETQPWKCYRNAVRRAKRLHQPPFSHYDKLTNRENVTSFIDTFLVESCGMVKVRNLGCTQWNREIILYASTVVT